MKTDNEKLLKFKILKDNIIKHINNVNVSVRSLLNFSKDEFSSISIQDIKKIQESSQQFKQAAFKLLSDDEINQSIKNNNILEYLTKLRYDFRNYINIIKGYTEIVLEDFQDNADIQTANIFLDIIDETKKIIDLIEEIRLNENLSLPSDAAFSFTVTSPASTIYSELTTPEFLEYKKILSILIVDSEEDSKILERFLIHKGFKNISIANDSFNALSMVENKKFDLLLLSIDMPNISGLDILKKLEKKLLQQQFFILMISSPTEHEKINLALQLGAVDFIPKPFHAELTQTRINSCAERQWLRSKL